MMNRLFKSKVKRFDEIATDLEEFQDFCEEQHIPGEASQGYFDIQYIRLKLAEKTTNRYINNHTKPEGNGRGISSRSS